MSQRPWRVVDAFTTEAFSGNPAGVLLLESDDQLSEELHQQIAAEANLSETAFVRPIDGDRFELRWFTPTTEVDLCGHATLAAGHVLGTEHARYEVTFETASGELRARREWDAVTIDLPALPVHVEADPAINDAVRAALGTELAELHATEGPTGQRNLLAVLQTADAVRSLQPDLSSVAALPAGGLIVTAPGDADGVHCVSRYFTPQHGIPEDPVTGAAHCSLGPYWCDRLGVDAIEAVQASRRGGRLQVRPDGNRVFLTGNAVTVVTGELHLP